MIFPARPSGDYAIIEFDAKYANGKHLSEQIIWTLGVRRRVAGRGLLLSVTRNDMLSAGRAEEDRSRDRQVSARPEAVGGDVGARDRAGREGLARARDDGFRRALPRHAAGRGLRGRDVLHDVQPCSRLGRHKITICTNLPCALQDAVKSAEYLKAKLGIDFGETTADGLVTLQEGECIGACGDAPVLLVNNKRMCSLMRRDKLDALLAELGAAGTGTTDLR